MYMAHHGIKGQKWGVRKYQNPDGTLTMLGRVRYKRAVNRMAKRKGYSGKGTNVLGYELEDGERLAKLAEKTGKIPKGTELYRITSKIDEPLDSNRKYVTLSKAAAYLYKDLAQEGRLTGSDKYNPDIAKITYESVKNMKVATTKQVENFIASQHPESKKIKAIQKDLDRLSNGYHWDKPINDVEKAAAKYVTDGSFYLNKVYKEALYKTKYDETNSVFKHFKDLGYDAVSDIEDGGIGGLFAPIIILNPSNSMKEKRKTYHDHNKGPSIYLDPDFKKYDPEIKYYL